MSYNVGWGYTQWNRIGRAQDVGNCKTELEARGVSHHFSLASFYQVNQSINALFVQTVRDWAWEHNPTQVRSYYGAGNIGAAIALKGIKVIGMDSAPSSIQDAKQTIQCHSLSMEVLEKMQTSLLGDAFFDVAVLIRRAKDALGWFPNCNYSSQSNRLCIL